MSTLDWLLLGLALFFGGRALGADLKLRNGGSWPAEPESALDFAQGVGGALGSLVGAGLIIYAELAWLIPWMLS